MQFWTAYTPEQVLQMAAQTLNSQGFATTFGPGVVSGARKDKANWIIAIILLLFAIVPGLVYLVLAGKHRTASLTAVEQSGLTLVSVTGKPAYWHALRKGIEQK